MATDPVTVKSTFTKATEPSANKVTDLEGVVAWDISTSGAVGSPTIGTGKYSGTEALLYGSSGSNYYGTVTMSTDYFKDYNVTSVKLYVRNNGSKKGTLVAQQGSVTIGTSTHSANTSAWGDLTVNTNKGAGGTLSVSYSVAQASYWSYIEVTYEEAEPDPTVQTLYLNPGASWLGYPAKYAVYYFKSSNDTENGWSEFMTLAENEENIYTTTIPQGYDKVIFARFNSEAEAPAWDSNKWSQTVNLDLPTDGKNQFTVTSGGTDQECDGEWGTYTPTVFADVYFVNKDGWAEDEIKLFGWLGSENNGWPGVAMTKTSSKLYGYDVYKGKIKETFTNVVISENGDETKRSGDQVFDKENPYFYDGAWYASLSVIPANCAIINASANGTAITLKAGAVVVYAEGKYNYIKDESGVTLIYKQDLGLQTGDTIIANIAGSVTVYKNLPEFVPTAASIAENEVKAGDAPAIADATDEPKAENLNQVVVYKNVTFESDEYSSRTITGLWNDKEITFYDQFNKEIKFDTEKIYNVTAAIAVYNSTYQAYIISAEPVCQDGPYAILVNDEDIVEAVATENQGEYKQFVAYLSLKENDKIALLNTSCGATWMPAIEEGGMSAHFAVEEGQATIDTTGCFDLYIKMKSGDEKIFIGAGICEGDTVYPAKFYIAGDSALVVNAGLDKEQAWNPAAIKSDVVSYKLNLAAGSYMLKITLNGTWDEGKVKGFDALTTVADGLTRGEGEANDNICFTLAEAGEVSVHYDGEFFFLSGNFYVAPVEVKYYLKNNWDGGEWTWKEMTKNEEDGTYLLEYAVFGGSGVNINTSASDEGARYVAAENIMTFDYTIFDVGVLGVLDTVAFVYDPEEYNSYKPEEQSGLSAYITGKYVAPEEPKLANGYYLVGDKYNWTPAAERLFVANGEGGEYVLAGVTLAAEDSLKVVYVENDAITTWYPAGTDNNYVVDAAHAGVKDIYFRPNYNGNDDWYEHCIYVAPNSGTAIDKVAGEAKAVKILKNGMLIIEKNGVKYNVLGVRL